MGIRFHCPNGHKLNVKAFLAGKKGVCPDCGVKLRIPEHSEPGLESGIAEAAPSVPQNQAATATATRAAVMPPPPMPAPVPTVPAPAVRPASPLAPTAPVPAAATTVAAMPVAAVPVPAVPMAHPAVRPIGTPGVPMPPPPPPTAPPGMRDPIAENPLATWFVRPPSGGQFGPARGEVMQKWITEGRVTSDSLVWREGWTDWLPATEVFPSLGKSASPLFSATPSLGKSAASIPLKKKGNGSVGMAILVFLVLICVILVAVLAVVLSGSLSST